MDLTFYQIIEGPVITDKAYKLNQKLKKLALKVHPQANKSLVKQALEKLFDVKVKKVNIMIRKGKNRTVKKRIIKGSLTKKAIVTLAEGYSLDIFDQGARPVSPVQESVKKKSTKGLKSADKA